ncbi:hypothetical protein DIPPA_11476 [Diplonema papillatum]|nr:hypothetical protein DIPPA_11476 [Diplonema papillatum]
MGWGGGCCCWAGGWSNDCCRCASNVGVDETGYAGVAAPVGDAWYVGDMAAAAAASASGTSAYGSCLKDPDAREAGDTAAAGASGEPASGLPCDSIAFPIDSAWLIRTRVGASALARRSTNLLCSQCVFLDPNVAVYPLPCSMLMYSVHANVIAAEDGTWVRSTPVPHREQMMQVCAIWFGIKFSACRAPKNEPRPTQAAGAHGDVQSVLNVCWQCDKSVVLKRFSASKRPHKCATDVDASAHVTARFTSSDTSRRRASSDAAITLSSACSTLKQLSSDWAVNSRIPPCTVPRATYASAPP